MEGAQWLTEAGTYMCCKLGLGSAVFTLRISLIWSCMALLVL